eukprot:gb/GEZN01017869.1/.p1 GENE.gb/GEZN01017869.1/~~gb/GEZN01017869.1/.p1  ORF type:complete len:149 (+),score=25.44 gb/GEZN01017869.1/:42-488(+)
MRFKNRYLLLELCLEGNKIDERLSANLIYKALRELLKENFGDMGLGCLLQSFQVKYFSNATNLCILRASRDNYRLLWTCATLVTSMNGTPGYFRSLYLGGTMRTCQRAAIAYNQQLLKVLQVEAPAAPVSLPSTKKRKRQFACLTVPV